MIISKHYYGIKQYSGHPVYTYCIHKCMHGVYIYISTRIFWYDHGGAIRGFRSTE